VHVYGKGWDELPAFAGLHRGFLDYDRVPAAYASARIVVDDAASSTQPFGSVNSRVFDALATGAVVVSNGVLGVEELFDTEFPTWSNADELIGTVGSLLADRDQGASIAARYRDVVLDRHTYARRGTEVRDALMDWTTATRWGIRIGVPAWDQVDQWGDYFFARAIQRILERTGVPTRVHLLPEWTTTVPARDDVSLHLFGLSKGPIRAAQVNLLWQISHPELASPGLYEQYDHVFVASEAFAAMMAPAIRVPVEPLHQATDPERFHPEPGGPDHELLFIANSRKVARKVTTDLAGTTHDLAVYGANWTADLIEPRFVKGESVPNADLARYYTAAAIVLNDHWDDMRAQGFLSNRLYDALACGACVISDDVEGIEAEFDGAVLTYREPHELEMLIERYLADPPARRLLGERGRKVVLERHTFEVRVAALMAAAAPLLADRSPAGRGGPSATAGQDA
jgi:spore maturation protein CgeB